MFGGLLIFIFSRKCAGGIWGYAAQTPVVSELRSTLVYVRHSARHLTPLLCAGKEAGGRNLSKGDPPFDNPRRPFGFGMTVPGAKRDLLRETSNGYCRKTAIR